MPEAVKIAPSPFSASHRSTRPAASSRLFGGASNAAKDVNREDLISQDAIRNARAALTGKPVGNPLEEPLTGLTSRGLLTQRADEITISDKHMDKMSDALSDQARLSARERVRAMRSGQQLDDEDDLPSLHRTQKMSFEGRSIKLQLGSRGAEGKNFVAIPEMTQTEDAAVRMGRGVKIVELSLSKDGKQNISLPSESLVKGSRNLNLEICFSDQQENLRRKTSERSID